MRIPAALLVAFFAASCGSQQTPDYQPSISEGARAQGAEAHPQLLAEFGGAYDGPEAAYVTRVGERIADAAGLPGQCTFTLVNSDVVNAFAVPGCYIYVTRGLVGLVNSEAELASVLGHELGHIVADHSARQQNRSLLRQLGVIAVGLITDSEALTRIAGQAAEFFTLRYSRTQEYESDDLGIRYMKAAGYDPYEAADMLRALTRQEQFASASADQNAARRMPEWTMTHPLTENRIQRAAATAKATGLADDALPEKVEPFLTELDGMLYGDDPQQGFVIGRRFLHPVMRIAFEAPPGFTLTNSPQAILIEGPGGLRGEFAGGRMPPGGLEAYAGALARGALGGMAAEAGQVRRTRINGLPAVLLPLRVSTPQGNAELTVAAYDAGDGGAYHFMVASEAGSAALDALFGSFRLLSAEQAAQLRPRQIRVVRAGPGDTVESLAGRMAAERPADRFLMLNALDAGATLEPGQRVKVVTYR